MFLPFFENLRKTGLPVSLREYLTFLEAMRAGLVLYDIDGFYYLARSAMVKDERLIDRFDRAFAATFSGLEAISPQEVLEAWTCPPTGWRRWPRRISARKKRPRSRRLAGSRR